MLNNDMIRGTGQSDLVLSQCSRDSHVMNLISSQSQPSVSNLQHVLSMWMARLSRLRFGIQVSSVVALSIKSEALVVGAMLGSGWVPSSCLCSQCSMIVPFAHRLILFFCSWPRTLPCYHICVRLGFLHSTRLLTSLSPPPAAITAVRSVPS